MKKGFWTVVKDIIRKADIVLEVLDARLPELTRIRKMEKIASICKKPVILVINKADIVSGAALKKLKKQYKDSNSIIISTKLSKGINMLVKKIKDETKTGNTIVAVIGYPNTGKSSLINQLSLGGKARTSSESGFTKGLQLIAGKNNLRLFDTPGVVPFSDRDELRLGLVSSISPSKLKDPDMVAVKLLKIFMMANPSALEEAYGIDGKLSPDEFLTEFGKKRNMLIKGGIVDERRAAIQLLIDWHKGKIKV